MALPYCRDFGGRLEVLCGGSAGLLCDRNRALLPHKGNEPDPADDSGG
jgi:hypothetical protein